MSQNNPPRTHCGPFGCGNVVTEVAVPNTGLWHCPCGKFRETEIAYLNIVIDAQCPECKGPYSNFHRATVSVGVDLAKPGADRTVHQLPDGSGFFIADVDTDPNRPRQNPIHWNPGNKVVHDHRNGEIIQPDTDIERAKRGLLVPWKPEYAEAETGMRDIP
jgi:hypothetical protein